MKKFLILLLILFSIDSYSQKSLVRNALSQAERGELEMAYANILKATDVNQNKSDATINWPRTWEVKGEICQKIFESKQPIIETPLLTALDSYIKALEVDKAGRYTNSLRIKLLLLQNNFVNQAVRSFSNEEFDKALKSFEGVLQISSFDFIKENPNEVDTVILYNAGLTAYHAKNWNKAISYFGEAAKHGYNGTKTYVFLAESYKNKNNIVGYKKTVNECLAKYPESKNLFGNLYKYSYSIQSNSGNNPLSFTNKDVKIDFEISNTSINFKLENLTEKPLKILWDNTSIVLFGEAFKVIHKGIKYSEKASHQPATLIPPRAAINDILIPAENIVYDNDLNKWTEKDLFPTNDKLDKTLEKKIMNFEGKSFSLFMPLEKESEEVNIFIEFIIKDIEKL
jgi:tetratricopeptide (TPR) repeat protein